MNCFKSCLMFLVICLIVLIHSWSGSLVQAFINFKIIHSFLPFIRRRITPAWSWSCKNSSTSSTASKKGISHSLLFISLSLSLPLYPRLPSYFITKFAKKTFSTADDGFDPDVRPIGKGVSCHFVYDLWFHSIDPPPISVWTQQKIPPLRSYKGEH